MTWYFSHFDVCIWYHDLFVLCLFQSFQDYVQASSRDVYNPVDHRGYWRQITVRTCCKGSILVIVCLHPQKLTEVSPGTGQHSLATSLYSVFTLLYINACSPAPILHRDLWPTSPTSPHLYCCWPFSSHNCHTRGLYFQLTS